MWVDMGWRRCSGVAGVGMPPSDVGVMSPGLVILSMIPIISGLLVFIVGYLPFLDGIGVKHGVAGLI